MVVDDDVLEKEDVYILGRIKEFISGDEVIRFAAAKQLLILLERAVCVSLVRRFGINTDTYDSNKVAIQRSR